MNKVKPSAPSSRSRFPLYHYISMGAALLAVLIIWKQQQAAQKQVKALIIQNSSLQQELKEARAEIDDFNSGDSSKATRERLAAARERSKPTPAVTEEVETLFLQPPTVLQTPDGLSVPLVFKLTDEIDLPYEVTLVVRIPSSGTSRILSLKPVSAHENSELSAAVNPSGNLGFIQCPSSALEDLSFELTVSGPVKAWIRGSKGIVPFELDIAPDHCTVNQLQ